MLAFEAIVSNMKKPRILFITPLPPPVHGSAMVSQYIKDCKELQEDFVCDFVNLSTSRNIDEIGKKSIMKYVRFFCSYLITLWKLLTCRYALCYLAITCHGMGFLKDAPFVLLCKLFRRRIVIHQHNKGMSGCVDKQPYKWLLPLTYRNTKVILLSWHLYPDIEKVVKKEQVLICPNGIPELFDKEPHFERNNEVPHLLFLSNLIPSKGVYVLLDACKQLKDKGYKFACDFVGGESKEITRDVFEMAVEERGLKDFVVYQGPKYGDDKKKFFADADIFVFPTYYYNECFPLVLLEAMQYKLPIISTDEGGIPDVVKDGINGCVCKRKDPFSLANGIEKLISDKEVRTGMGAHGYKMFKEKFTLYVFNNNMTRILKELAS